MRIHSAWDKCLEKRLLLRMSATNVFKQLWDHWNCIDRLHRPDATISYIKQSISDWSAIIFKLSQFKLTINLVPALSSLITGIENFLLLLKTSVMMVLFTSDQQLFYQCCFTLIYKPVSLCNVCILRKFSACKSHEGKSNVILWRFTRYRINAKGSKGLNFEIVDNSNSGQEQLRKMSLIGPPAGIEPTLLWCRCSPLHQTHAQSTTFVSEFALHWIWKRKTGWYKPLGSCRGLATNFTFLSKNSSWHNPTICTWIFQIERVSPVSIVCSSATPIVV